MQHGYGKGQKIRGLADSGLLRGVILSSADEDSVTLAHTVRDSKARGLKAYVDPQTYIYSMAPRGIGRNHENHGILFNELHWSQDARALASHVRRVGEMHEKSNSGGVMIAPTVLQASFEDVWTSTAFQYARTAADAWGKDQTVASLVIEESALDTWTHIEDWLDVATTLEVRGFYILVSRPNTTYPPVAWSVERLTNLLRLVYSLTELNGYEVCWGYSDAEGILGLAAGASAMAVGWNYSLRQFKPSKWQPSDKKGARQPTPRYYLRSVWSPLLAVGEADNIWASEFREAVFGPEDVVETSNSPLDELSVSAAQLQFLTSLARQANEIGVIPRLSDRLGALDASLTIAVDLLGAIDAAGYPLSSRYAPRVRAMKSALSRFREAEIR